MASTVSDILADIVQTLRQCGCFRLVTLGPAGSATDLPRAEVIYDGRDGFQADDSPTSQWGRVSASVNVHTRSTDVTEAITRADQLCQEVIDALLADPFRGGRCCDLPIGRATEAGRGQLVSGVKPPEVEMTVGIRCHFETGGD